MCPESSPKAFRSLDSAQDDRDCSGQRYGQHTIPRDLHKTLALSPLHEREFFIRKAIGWVLREVAKKHPDRVRAFLREREGRVSGVTRREAERYLT